METLAVATAAGHQIAQLAAEGDALFQINLFWVIVGALNFILFFAIIYAFALKPVTKILSDRQERIEQGLKDAEQARRDRDSAEAERVATLGEARREANEILARAQKVAQESRDAEIEAEKTRAIADVRAEVADLALQAAGKVVGETMTDERQRRLVEEFLSTAGTGDAKN